MNVLDEDPLFVSQPDFNTAPTTSGDLRLLSCSPAIDIGNNAENSGAEDLDGNPRIVNSIIDLGAYEFQNIGGAAPPVALCQSQTVQLDAMGNGSLAVSSLDGGSTGCATLTFSIEGETTLTFNCSDIGSNAVTLTVTDASSNSSTCTATVTVEDMVMPTAICKAYTVQLDATGNGSLSASDINNGSSDVCGSVTLSASPNSFNCSNIGLNTVTLTVTDEYSNFATCNAQVTVEDATMPQITCPNNMTIHTASEQCEATVNFAATATDACDGSPILSYSQDPGTLFPVGTTTVTATATDDYNNSSSCTFDIELIENVAPMVCQDIHVQLDEMGTTPITPEMVVPLSTPDITFNATGNLQNWIVPAGVTSIRIEAAGAQGGSANTQIGGKGAVVAGDFSVTPGTTYQIIVAKQGSAICGGGATFIALGTNGYADFTSGNILLIAGGGGGVSINKNGGSATVFQDSSNGNGGKGVDVGNNSVVAGGGASAEHDGGGGRGSQRGGKAAINGAAGGIATNSLKGGYGGGGGGDGINVVAAGGGGGGATGGNGGSGLGAGSGGTSFNGGDNPANIPGANTGHGYVKIYYNYSLDGLSVAPTNFSCSEAGTTQTVTVTRTNCDNSTSTCTAQVTVDDITLPTAMCQSHTVQLNASGNGNLTANNINNGSSDVCGIASLSASPNAFDCSDIGTNSVTLTVTDNSGNKNTCTTTVTVEDNILPSANCKAYTVQLDASGNGSLTASDIDNSSSDACGIALLSASPTSFTCIDAGTNNVSLTVTDNNGKVNTCTATVTVEDSVLPTAKCKPYTVQLNASGNGSLTANNINNGSSDACGIASLSASPNTFTCADVGSNNVTLTVTDNNGKVNTCTATVTVEDKVSPSAVCYEVYTVQLGASGNGSLAGSDLDSDSYDACGIASLSALPNTFDCSDIGQNTVTLTLTDNSGNESTCFTTVTVEDNVLPTAICKTTLVQLGGNGNGSLTADDIDNGSSDACGIASISASPNTFTCSDIGTNNVTLTVTDNNGNESTCTATVTVEDNVLPTANCKPHTVQLDASGNGSLTANNIDNSSADACGIASLSASPNSFTCADVGNNMVTLTVTDMNGNENTCTATVTVEDNTNPIPSCKTTTAQLNSNGQYILSENDVLNGGSDNCGSFLFWYMTPTMVDCADEGATVPVTVYVFDANGNHANCTANISVEDSQPPVPVCLNPTVQLGNNGAYALKATDVFGGGTDNCGLVQLTSFSPAVLDCGQAGTTVPVTVTTNDGNGNSANCTANVTVEDKIAPVAICQNAVVQLDGSGNGSLSVNDVDGGSSDNCGVDDRTLDLSVFACADVGPNTVTLTITDLQGNSSTCQSAVMVEDNIAPSANCTTQTIQAVLDANGQYSINPSDLNDGSFDVCGNLSFSVSPSVLTCQNEGSNTVTLLVSDGHGNIATCTATVQVAEFLQVLSVIPTSESCSGNGDGSIVITAVAGGGQVGYSINGGSSFQFDGHFNNLTPGSYNILVKVFGIGNICEKTAVAVVGSGGTPTLWYQDNDGDGYTNGNTLMSCTQPPNYSATAQPGDCNDNDPTEFPGQAWYEDFDGDGFGNGSWQTGCQRPAGCYLQGELTAIDGDCDDNNALIFPDAPEICNGLDDDCDGEIDEETSGGLTYTGNVIFYSQTDVNAFSQCYSVIDGNLMIAGATIDSLNNLKNLKEVTGNVNIQFNGLENLAGLDSLSEIGGGLTIYYNNSLTTLSGLEGLNAVGGSLMIYYNFLLDDCCAIYDLLNENGVTGSEVIFFNKTGCNNVAEIIANCAPQSLVSNPTNTGTNHAVSQLNHQKASAQATAFSMFPNPARDQVIVKLSPDNKVKSLQVLDVFGKNIAQVKVAPGADRVELDLSQLVNGTYLIQAQVSEGVPMAQKLVVIKD
jgi:uncharacterized protein YrzB (UPF0473 family)